MFYISIALNGFWTYNLPGGSTITQGTLDGYDVASTAFISAALANSALQGRLAGLTAYGNAYHLRPGVQITSSGDLLTSGDIDLAGYRYGLGANRDPNSPAYGAGEPMALVVRAGGNLSIKGSISDGFKASAGIPATVAAIDVTNSSFFAQKKTEVGADSYTYWFDQKEDVIVLNDWTIPDNAFYNWWTFNWWGNLVDSKNNYYNPGDTIRAGTIISASNSYGFAFEPSNMPNVAVVVSPAIPGAAPTAPMASMLSAGLLSASIRLVSGGDLAAADQRELQAMRALNGGGNLTLSATSYNASRNGTYFSVLRTGIGNLELLAGGSFSEATPYGVYTAGTQAAPILAADGNPYDLIGVDGTTHAWYPEHGGDLLLMAQQDVSAKVQLFDNVTRYVDSDSTANWLWRQGGGGVTPDPTAWWINFGSIAKTSSWTNDSSLVGFQGIGTLGGGNLTLIAGRNAGVANASSTALDLAVASTGRVAADGTLVQTGGGDLIMKIGGMLNPMPASQASNRASDYFGAVTNLRGNITVNAGAVGAVAQFFGSASWTSYDPRAVDPNVFSHSQKTPGPIFTPGDGTVRITARGDLVFGGAGDATMATPVDRRGGVYTVTDASGKAYGTARGALSSFTLWTPATAINLYAAGGDVAPLTGNTADGNYSTNFYPGTLIATAANGDVRFSEPGSAASFGVLELVPSPLGQFELLAAGSIYGTSQVVAMSGSNMSALATPVHPVFQSIAGANASPTAPYLLFDNDPIAFGEDTPSGFLHAQDRKPAMVYAGVDIQDLTIGRVSSQNQSVALGFHPTHAMWYAAAKPFEVIAGRDIVGTGTTPSVFLNTNANDITLIQAGRDIFYQSIDIVGPGLLQVQAGRNLYQGYYGSLTSVGDVANPSNRSGGAGITVLAGVGANGPDYTAFAKLYFDTANQLSTGIPLAGSGKVARTYDEELFAWLQQRFGYSGTSADALAYFLALPSEQQGVFVRQVYFKELLAGGREYNDPTSSRYGSYLRGREAVATLFPSTDAQGNAMSYQGDITMFSGITGSKTVNGQTVPVVTDAGIHTNFGGDIQMLNPGGKTIVGVEGVPAGAGAGLITQGTGNIDLYSKGSILLGLSRIMTTFGGSIQGWSAEGDINAGRGSKTTVVYTPPKRVYDEMSNVTISPTVPSSGAGIATLSPIPEVPAGDVDLVAPLGTIDAGEAGIRVSGNVNFAALAVVNAANVQVQGKSTGLPVMASVNVGALTNASAVASTAATAAQDAMSRERASARQAMSSIFSIRMLGTGGEAAPDNRQADPQAEKPTSYRSSSAVQVLGGAHLGDFARSQLTEAERRSLGL
ncbi:MULTISPECIES: filamentous haemagglutinin family protein [Pandoraea]|uniref:Heme/hemopexin-binding protein n=1 Tax=Pandoraea communis TaxID=2508297 RepID=A0A5E4XUT2_9BURK|nr:MULTISPECIES: filamentous haemagglutinin family protein [Pandoraea]ALS66641.1 hypothetical protein AT395_18105 [Pandoraea apista]CFB61375.1 Filamentous haemagglutinin family outer membrane protein [Pandoraea apista]VVE39842.1 Heme/hemopexin-binding protein [Pandoraea communis]